ncbi:MAG: methylenetetrahydrofolate reductase C-terminal domain-containing protein [Candidatus Omnitrophica bacterium]|nr:methylenetetrahydrofolate reductase C-terminal domain-containing protein [Candidatus Omnitrophota bacterium]
MHATIQKPLDKIVGFLKKGEKIFVVGCGNCAEKCRSGGEEQAKAMKSRLENKGVRVTGYAATASGSSLCKLSVAKKLLNKEHEQETRAADSFLVLACGQGIHTVMDATDAGNVYPGCDTIFGGETVNDDYITEYCSLCGECIVEYTGGLCPLTLCTKSLLNGPCGGAKDGKCEVDRDQDCGWQLIYERLKNINKLDLMYKFREPKDYSKWSRPRNLKLEANEAEFKSLAGIYRCESSV